MVNDLILRILVSIPGFLFAVVCHEWAHAYVAYKFGDDTAKRHGRLSLNPMAHIDWLGTVILPLILAFIGGMMFGWAKPVPVDARGFKDIRKSIFWVSFAGPLANIIVAVIVCFLLACMVTFVPRDFYLFEPFILILTSAMQINIVLAIFNLIPFPPLDGSKMISAFMDYNTLRKYETLTTYSFPIMIVLMWTGALGYIIGPFILLGNGLFHFFISVMA